MSSTSSKRLSSEAEETTRKHEVDCLSHVKSSIFAVYSKLVNHRRCGYPLAFILYGFTFLQIANYILEIYNEILSFDSVFNFLFDVTGFFRIVPTFARNEISGSLFILLTILSLIGLVYAIGIIGYTISASRGKFKMHSWVSWILQTISFFLIYVLASPVFDLLFGIFICRKANHTFDSSIVCWSSFHIIIISVFTPFLILLFICIIAASVLFNEFLPHCKDAMNRMDDSYLELQLVLYKIMLSFLSQFWEYNEWNLNVIPLLLITFPLLYFGFTAVTRFPYYKTITYYLYTSGILLNLWFCFILIMEEIIGHYNSGVVIISSTLLVPLAIYQHRNKVVYNLIYKERPDHIDSEPLLALYSNICLDLIRDHEDNYLKKITLAGLIAIHVHECFNPECILRKEPIEPLTVYKHVLKYVLDTYTKHINATPNIYIFYSCFLIEVYKNIFKAATQLLQAEKIVLNLQEEFSVFRAKRLLVTELKKTQLSKKSAGAESVDVKIAIQYDELLNKLEMLIEEIANSYVDFWSNLELVTPDLNVVHSKGVEIMKAAAVIDEIWQDISNVSTSNHRINTVYGKYMQVLKNDKDGANTLLNDARYNEPKTVDKANVFGKDSVIFADDTGIIIAKESGIILKHNIAITTFFSYSSAELVGQNVQMLMPPIIGKNHKKLIEAVINTGNEGKLCQIFTTLALHRFGHIFSVMILVKPVPALNDGLEFIAFMRRCEKNECLILTDLHGRIEGFSSSFGELLEIAPAQLQAHEMYLQTFCPNLADIVPSQKEDQEKVTLLDTFPQVNQKEGMAINLTIILTKDHKDLLSRLQLKQKNKDIQPKSTYDILKEYTEHVYEIVNYKNETEENLIARVIPQSNAEFKKTFKGYHWFNEYGDGMIKLRLFKLKKGKRRINKKGIDRYNTKQLEFDIVSLRQNANSAAGNSVYKSNQVLEAASLKANSIPVEDANPATKNSNDSELEMSFSKSEYNNDQNEGVLLQGLIKETLMDKKANKESQAMADDTSSTINSSTFSFGRQIQMMRNSVNQSITPKSIRNLKCVALIVFLVILVLAIVCFVFLENIFSNIKNKIVLFRSADAISDGIITITAMTRLLLSDIYSRENAPYDNVVEHFQSSIKTMAIDIQNSLNSITVLGNDFLYNQDTIMVNFNNPSGFMENYEMEADLSILTFTIHALKVANTNQNDFNANDIAFSFVILNGFDSIISNIHGIFNRIIGLADYDKTNSIRIMLILVLIGSISLVIGFSVLLPVIISVGKNREVIVLMFTEISLQKIKEEADKCRQYCSQFHCGEEQSSLTVPVKLPAKDSLSQIPIDALEPQQQTSDQEEAPLNISGNGNNEAFFVPQKHVANIRRYIKFSNPIIRTIVALTFFISVLESYFLIFYFQPSTALKNFINLAREQGYSFYLRFYDSFSFHAVQVGIATNFEERIMGQGQDFVIDYVDKLIDTETQYYNEHKANIKIHNKEYNELYYEIVSQTMCKKLSCTDELYEFPDKGMHQLNVAFWEMLRTVLADYVSGLPAEKALNDARMVQTEVMLNNYIYKGNDILNNGLENEFKKKFDNEIRLLLIVFIVYLLVVMAIFLMWQIFIASMNTNLNYTRTLLAIIPPDVIREKKIIRDYIISTSKLILSSTNN